MPLRDSLRATLVATIWGANFVVIDEGMRGFPPFLLLSVRFMVVLLPLVFIVPRPAPWATILRIGVFMSLGQFVLLYLALHLGMPAGLASLVVQAQVIASIGISRLVLKEHPSRRQLVGVAIGLIGLAVLVLGRAGGAPLLPLLLVLAACLSWSVGNVLTRRAQIVSGLGLTVWSGIMVPLPALALALLVDGPHAVGHAVSHIDVLTVASTLYTALGSSLFGYGVWNSLLSRYPVGAVVPFALLVPPAGITTAWIVLGQRPGLSEVVGGAILLAGIAVTTLQRAAARQAVSSVDRCPESVPLVPPPTDCLLSPSPASPV